MITKLPTITTLKYFGTDVFVATIITIIFDSYDAMEATLSHMKKLNNYHNCVDRVNKSENARVAQVVTWLSQNVNLLLNKKRSQSFYGGLLAGSTQQFPGGHHWEGGNTRCGAYVCDMN